MIITKYGIWGLKTQSLTLSFKNVDLITYKNRVLTAFLFWIYRYYET